MEDKFIENAWTKCKNKINQDEIRDKKSIHKIKIDLVDISLSIEC